MSTHKQLRTRQGDDDDLNLIPCAPPVTKCCRSHVEALRKLFGSCRILK